MTTESIDPLEKLRKKIREQLMGRIHDGKALDRYTDTIMFDVETLISAHYISRERVLEAIGEDESTKNCGGGVYAVRITGRNKLRAEIRKELNL